MDDVKRFIGNLYKGDEMAFYGAEVVLAPSHEKALDAQRLRADTAEAELRREKEFHAVNVSESERMLAAAEQRIADLIELLRGAWKYADHDLNVVTVNRELAARIEAALNQKSEGESHE
jgi:hypothetical protein